MASFIFVITVIFVVTVAFVVTVLFVKNVVFVCPVPEREEAVCEGSASSPHLLALLRLLSAVAEVARHGCGVTLKR